MAKTVSKGGNKKMATSSGDSQSNMYGAVAYFATLLTGVLMLLMKPEDKYVKYHAWQAILLGVVFGVLYFVALAFAAIPYVGWIVALMALPLLGLAYFILWLYCMWKAYSGEKFKLPVIGDFAEKQAAQ